MPYRGGRHELVGTVRHFAGSSLLGFLLCASFSIPVALARHSEPNQVKANTTGAPTNATVPAVWLSVKVDGIARNQTTAKTAAGTALAADIFWNGVLKVAFRLATVESNWLVRLVMAVKCSCSIRRVGG